MMGLVLGSILLVGGCVEREVKGDAVEFSYAMWAPITVLLVGLAAAPIGLLLRNSSKRATWIGLILSPVLLIGLLPGMFMDYAKVDDNHFEGRYGIWFAPTKFNIAYSDLSHIDHTIYTTRGRRGRKNTNERLDCAMKSGEVQKVSLGTMLKEAKEDIFDRAQAAKVPVRLNDERK
jgi:hypothetical protein